MTDQPEHAGVGGLAERVLSLGREVDSLRRMTDTQREGLRDVRATLDDQHGDLTEHATALAGLGTALASLAEQVAEFARDKEEDQARAASWFEMADPARAVQRLTSLVTWLDRVYIRFPGAELPGCWLWHPPVVEELLWLQRAWTEAFHGRSAATFRAADWHDRQRPNVVRRITEYAGRCALAEHVPRRRTLLGRAAAGVDRRGRRRHRSRLDRRPVRALPDPRPARRRTRGHSMTSDGRTWAKGGATAGAAISVAANIAHSYIPPAGAPAEWSPKFGAVLSAVIWPVALFVAIEVLARSEWPSRWYWWLIRVGGLLPIIAVAAVVSYQHLSGLLRYYGEGQFTQTFGPVAIDGLMVICTAALVASARQITPARPVGRAAPDTPADGTPDSDTEPDRAVSDPPSTAVSGPAGGDDAPARRTPPVAPPASPAAAVSGDEPADERDQLAAARAWVRKELWAGKRPSGAEVGRRYGRPSRWGQRVVNHSLAEYQQRAPGTVEHAAAT